MRDVVNLQRITTRVAMAQDRRPIANVAHVTYLADKKERTMDFAGIEGR